MTDVDSTALGRFASALPDAAAAAVFLFIWMHPLALGDGAVNSALLVMLVEFILVHASGFFGGMVLDGSKPRRVRLMSMLGLAAFYLLFIGIFMAIFREWWPLAAFAWLLLGKFAGVIGRPGSAKQRKRMQAGWMLGAVFYIGGVFATVFLPIPQLGVTAEVLPQLGLEGAGLWVDEPHRLLAFGTLYFAFSAWSKWRDWLVNTLQV